MLISKGETPKHATRKNETPLLANCLVIYFVKR